MNLLQCVMDSILVRRKGCVCVMGQKRNLDFYAFNGTMRELLDIQCDACVIWDNSFQQRF